MDFKFSPEEEAFRDEVRAFLDENLPAGPEWNQKVRAKGWVGFSWPKEVGGGGGTLMEQVILKDEMASRKAPALGSCFMGLAWVGPSLIEYGTEEQKARFVPDILDSKYQWCTGYSEPGSGSDLASLQCKAVREGDGWRMNGSKIFTTSAHFAEWYWLGTRTDPDEKHMGITLMLVPLDQEGVTINGIWTMGDERTNDVFFDDVFVPDEYVVGELNHGFRYISQALDLERFTMFTFSPILARFELLCDSRELANGYSELNDPVEQRARFEDEQRAKDAGDAERDAEPNNRVQQTAAVVFLPTSEERVVDNH